MKKGIVLRTTNKDNKKSFSGNSESYKRGEHPNSQSNLTPYEKGESGNPNGRPQKFSRLKDELNEVGDEELWTSEPEFPFDKPKTLIGTRREIVLRKIWNMAQCGDMTYITILERLGCLNKK
jgi:hypothetical protein